jgi:hypothetical protein
MSQAFFMDPFYLHTQQTHAYVTHPWQTLLLYTIFFVNMLFSLLFKYIVFFNVAFFIIAIVGSFAYLPQGIECVAFILSNLVVSQVLYALLHSTRVCICSSSCMHAFMCMCARMYAHTQGVSMMSRSSFSAASKIEFLPYKLVDHTS